MTLILYVSIFFVSKWAMVDSPPPPTSCARVVWSEDVFITVVRRKVYKPKPAAGAGPNQPAASVSQVRRAGRKKKKKKGKGRRVVPAPYQPGPKLVSNKDVASKKKKGKPGHLASAWPAQWPASLPCLWGSEYAGGPCFGGRAIKSPTQSPDKAEGKNGHQLRQECDAFCFGTWSAAAEPRRWQSVAV